MSKKKRIILSIITILGLFFMFLFLDEIVFKTKIYINCHNEYSSDFHIEKIVIDDDDRLIGIYFAENSSFIIYDETKIFDIYDKIYETIFGYKKFDDYTLNIGFGYKNGQSTISVFNINKDKTKIIIDTSYIDSISISDIASRCPEVNRININKICYDSIEDFSKFTNLESIWCYNDIIDIDEKRYILSLFPDCEIGWYEQ